MIIAWNDLFVWSGNQHGRLNWSHILMILLFFYLPSPKMIPKSLGFLLHRPVFFGLQNIWAQHDVASTHPVQNQWISSAQTMKRRLFTLVRGTNILSSVKNWLTVRENSLQQPIVNGVVLL
jgi:hypothetical protein